MAGQAIAAGCAVLAVAAVGSAVFGYLNLRRAREANAQALAAEAKALAAAETARQAEERALQVRKLAEAARVEAEKLVSFLLDDFYDELAPTGRLATVGRLAKQSADYYAGLPEELRSQATERGRAIALARYGASLVYQSGTNGEVQATKVLEQAIMLLEKLRDEGDDTESTVIGLVIAQKSLADAQNSLGGYSQSFATMKRMLETVRPVMEKPGASRRLRQIFGEALTFFGYLQDRVYTTTENASMTLAEARQILVELGAKSMTDLNAASAYAEAAFVSRLPQGANKLAVEDRRAFVTEARQMAEAVLAKRPGDLRALRTRADALTSEIYSYAILSERNSESLTAAKMEVLVDAEDCWAEYLRYDSSDSDAWGSLGNIRWRIATALLDQGRVKLAEEKIESALAIERELTVTPTLAAYVQNWWLAAAEIAAYQGDRDGAAKCLQNLQRVVDVRISVMRPDSTSRVGPQEGVYIARRRVQRQFGDFEALYRDAHQALVRSESYNPATNVGKSGKQQRLNEAQHDLVFAAFKTGRFQEAEQVLRKIAEDRGEARPSERVMHQVWLALALFRQNRIEEARGELARVADQLVNRSREIDSNLKLRFDYLYALYTQAVLQPADVSGAARRRELLAEAVALCNEQSDEVKTIRTYKDVRTLIDEAVKQTVP